MRAFFNDAEGFKIFVFVEFAAFGEAVFVQGVLNFARWLEGGYKDGNDAKNY